MSVTRLPLPHDDVIGLVQELLDRAVRGELKFFVSMAVTRDGEVLTAHSGDRTSARPFEMAGFLESLKLNLLLLHDDELRANVSDAADNPPVRPGSFDA